MEDFEKQLQDILEGYEGDVAAMLNGTAEEIAVEAAKELQRVSPRGKSRKKKYYKGWVVTQQKVGVQSFTYVVHNKNKPWLTQLLEKPHLTRSGNTVTPASAGHIANVEKWCKEEYLERVKKAISSGSLNGDWSRLLKGNYKNGE